MFWQSFWLGIKSISDWHILVGVAGVGISAIACNTFSSWSLGEGRSAVQRRAGFWFAIFGAPIVQGIAVSCFVVFCLPAILFGQGFTPLPIIGAIGVWGILIGLLTVVGILGFCFLPIVGALARLPGFSPFVQGIIMLHFTANALFAANNRGSSLPDEVFPELWLSAAYVLLALVFCYAGVIVSALVASTVEKMRGESTALPTIVGIVIGPLINTLPLLMYGKYVALGIQSLPPNGA